MEQIIWYLALGFVPGFAVGFILGYFLLHNALVDQIRKEEEIRGYIDELERKWDKEIDEDAGKD